MRRLSPLWPLALMAMAAPWPSIALATEPWKTCVAPKAQAKLAEGMASQRDLESVAALAAYAECLKIEPGCLACRYESGWSHWKLGQWAEVVDAWETVLKAAPAQPDIPQYLPTAKENLGLVKAKKIPQSFVSGVAIGEKSEPAESPLSLLLLARRQSYNPQPEHPTDVYDADIQSPKAVRFTADGKKAYVNSLEGGRTVVYDALGLEKRTIISHKFTAEQKGLFRDGGIPWGYSFPKSVKAPNEFLGKPVELELSHKGKYLWVPYYRRSFDANGAMPSALAVVDTEKDEVVRVMAAGPISKYVKRSHTGRWMAVSHWGDNTVGLIDIRGSVDAFRHERLLTVEKRVDPSKLHGDRDRNCGFCVRGLAFSPDDRHLFVSRMSGGGIAVFGLQPKRKVPPVYLGTIFGVVPGPRDLEIFGNYLYVSCNASGVVARVPWKNLVKKLAEVPAGTDYEKRSLRAKSGELGEQRTYVGLGARSFRVSDDGHSVFVAVNQTSEVVGVDTATMTMAARIPVDSFPVGLDLNPAGNQLWVTSQGRQAKGGNSVAIFQVRQKTGEVVPARTSIK